MFEVLKMVDEKQNSFICTNCSAEIPAGTRFCTECGAEQKSEAHKKSVDQKIICPGCSAELPAGSRFCTDCGSKIDQPIFVGSDDQKIICPGCSAELPAGSRFCTDCGSKIDQPVFVGSDDQKIICPGCSAELPAGSRFCTDCGSKIEQVPVSGSLTQNMPVSDETVESVKKTGRGLLKGMGGFLDKAAASIDDATQSGAKYRTKVEQPPSYIHNPQVNNDDAESVKDKSKGLLKGMGGFLDNATASIDNSTSNETEVDNRGYVVCEECGGYYELEEGEYPDDFESCSCGGKLKYVKNLET